MEYALITVVAAIIVFLCLRIRAQDAIIKDLTDRVMARSYTDYVSGKSAGDAPASELHVRKPISWYDDPMVPDGDKT